MLLLVDPDRPFAAAVRRRLAATPGAPEIRTCPLDPAAIKSAARGCRTLVLGGMPGRWSEVPPIVDAAVEASEEHGCAIVHAITVDGLKVIYGVPLPARAPVGEAIDQIGPEGRTQNLMQDQLEQHADLTGRRVLLLRAGDLFGPGVREGFGADAAAAARAREPVPWYGALDLPHAFTDVDTLAEVALGVLALDGRPVFEIVNVPSHIVTAAEWAASWSGAGGGPRDPRRVPHWLVRGRALFDPGWRARAALLWGWEGSVLLDERATRALGFEPRPLAQVVADTLAAGA